MPGVIIEDNIAARERVWGPRIGVFVWSDVCAIEVCVRVRVCEREFGCCLWEEEFKGGGGGVGGVYGGGGCACGVLGSGEPSGNA